MVPLSQDMQLVRQQWGEGGLFMKGAGLLTYFSGSERRLYTL